MSIPATQISQRTLLLDHLAAIDVDTSIVPYPAHNTVEEGKRLRGNMAGTFTKNLLLKDKKSNLFFVTAHEDTDIDLKTLHTRIGGRGRLGFASPDLMAELLHVAPGTATPLALFHDTDTQITLVIDECLEGVEQVNFHPMTQTQSIGLTWDNFTTFLQSTGHAPLITTMS